MTREAREAVAAARARACAACWGGAPTPRGRLEEDEEAWKEEWEDVAPDDVGGGDGGGRVSRFRRRKGTDPPVPIRRST